jgi:hypothetical protein
MYTALDDYLYPMILQAAEQPGIYLPLDRYCS